MINFKFSTIFLLSLIIIILSSCSYIFTDHQYDYLKEEIRKPLKIPDSSNSKAIIDYYPVPSEKSSLVLNSYEIPLPEQVFSSGSSNDIRLHKLGELRWLYVETLPSSAWPLMKDFWANSEYGLFFEDPNVGVLESNIFLIGGTQSKLRMKIEHGIRQASSELFVSHLIQDELGSWTRFSSNENLEDKVLRSVMDFLSKTTSKGGTSLVALNLNLGQKAMLKQEEDGSNFIAINLEYPRAWAAVDRALKEAIITVTDLDRENGIFYVNFIQKEEKGFFGRMFGGDEILKGSFKIFVKEEGKKCKVTVEAEDNNSGVYERELLSQINQSLS